MSATDDKQPAGLGTGPGDSDEMKVGIYHRINRLREKAGGSRYSAGGGILDPKAVAQAQANAMRMAPEYPTTVGKELDELLGIAEGLVTLPKGQHKEHLDRAAHLANEVQSLGMTFGYDLVTVFGRSLRNFTDQLEAADEAQIILIRAHVDTIRVVVAQKITGDGGEHGRALIAELRKALMKHGGERAADSLDEIIEGLH